MTVTAQVFDFGKNVRVKQSTIKERHVMPARLRRFDQMTPQKFRPAENQ